MTAWETDLIVATLAGSHLYGTARPDSDVDIRGVCFSPRGALLGLTGFEQYYPSRSAAVAYSTKMFGRPSDDVTIYALGKFFALCLDANPNIIELLFAPEDCLLAASSTWETIVGRRNLFLSTKIIHTFAGYAYSQLKRIRGHKRWLDSPPEKPNPHHYGLVETEEGGSTWTDSNQYNAYQSKLKDRQAYVAWRKNRNPARAMLEERHGYDTKHASHLYRLVLEAEELLTTGHLTLPLKPAVRDQVLAVLNGEVVYEDVVAMGKDAKDRLAALEKISPLPQRPNRKAAEQLLISLQLAQLGEG